MSEEILKQILEELKAQHKDIDYQLRRLATRIEEKLN